MKNPLLIVDDEPNVLLSLQRVLLDEPWEIYTAGNGEDALEIMKHHKFKVVVSDERMPGMGGAEFLSFVRELYPETIRIMLTGHAGLEATMKAVNKGEIYRFFAKPWEETEMLLALRSAMEKYDLEAENRVLRKIVKNQATEIKLMEMRYPGITKVDKDLHGNILLPDMSDEEMANILAEFGED